TRASYSCFVSSALRLSPTSSSLLPSTTLFRSSFWTKGLQATTWACCCAGRRKTTWSAGRWCASRGRSRHLPALHVVFLRPAQQRSEEHTSELSHVAISYAVFCLKKKK